MICSSSRTRRLLHFRIVDNRVVRIHGCSTCLTQEPSRPVKQIRRNAMAASSRRPRLSRFKTLLMVVSFCSLVNRLRQTSPVSNSTCRNSLDTSLSSSLCLSLSAYDDCPVEMGGSLAALLESRSTFRLACLAASRKRQAKLFLLPVPQRYELWSRPNDRNRPAPGRRSAHRRSQAGRCGWSSPPCGTGFPAPGC